jgi:NAD(P)-dependent dehydrogenase (short-subunit alcohol dehydrogenase family)
MLVSRRRNTMPSVLVTGTNRGLGLEFVRQYAREGWQVHATCREPARASELRAIAAESRGRVQLLALDVSDPASVRQLAADLRDASLDLLVNNAGIEGKSRQRIGNIDYDAWRQVLDVNVLGPMRVTEALCDQVARSERKLVVTITSGMGSLTDNTSGGSIAYRSSKAAVNMVMRSNAIDLAPLGIICVVVNPGWVLTDMGGPNARMTPQASIAALRRLFERIEPGDSGKFFNYDGTEYPW